MEHFKSDCLKKKRDMKNGKGGKNRKEKGTVTSVATDAMIAGQEDFVIASEAQNTVLLVQTNTGLMDSAATSHVCKDCGTFLLYKKTPNYVIKGLEGHKVEARRRGTINVYFSVKEECIYIALTDVLHAPASENNLMSLGCITDSGHRLAFVGNNINILSPQMKIIGTGKKARGLYQMDIIVPGSIDWALIAREPRSWEEWYRVMGHISYASVKLMKAKGMVDRMEVDTSEDLSLQCTTCIQVKHTISSFPKELISQLPICGVHHTCLGSVERGISLDERMSGPAEL